MTLLWCWTYPIGHVSQFVMYWSLSLLIKHNTYLCSFQDSPLTMAFSQLAITVSNLLFWAYNLFCFLIPVYIPDALRVHFAQNPDWPRVLDQPPMKPQAIALLNSIGSKKEEWEEVVDGVEWRMVGGKSNYHVSSDNKWRFTYCRKKDWKCDNFHMYVTSVMVILYCVSTIISTYHLFLVMSVHVQSRACTEIVEPIAKTSMCVLKRWIFLCVAPCAVPALP